MVVILIIIVAVRIRKQGSQQRHEVDRNPNSQTVDMFYNPLHLNNGSSEYEQPVTINPSYNSLADTKLASVATAGSRMVEYKSSSGLDHTYDRTNAKSARDSVESDGVPVVPGNHMYNLAGTPLSLDEDAYVATTHAPAPVTRDRGHKDSAYSVFRTESGSSTRANDEGAYSVFRTQTGFSASSKDDNYRLFLRRGSASQDVYT